MKITAISVFAAALLALPLAGAAEMPGARDLLVKATGPAVYYYAEDGKRYVFPNERVYYSWFTDFSGIVMLTDEELASIPIGGNVTYRPGIRLVKIESDPKVYAVASGGVLRWIEDEQTAKDLYGRDWNKLVDDVDVALFVNYAIGDSLACACGYLPETAAAQATSINADKGIETTANTRLSDTAVPEKKIDLNDLTEEGQRAYLAESALEDINRIRADYGKAPLVLSDQLTEIALAHSMDMALNLREMSHEGSLGEQAHERIKQGKVPDFDDPGRFRYLPYPEYIGWSGENVGLRYLGDFGGDPEAAVADQHEWFMDEPDGEFNHRTTMLSSMVPFTEVGIGIYIYNDAVWITEDFISRTRTVTPEIEDENTENIETEQPVETTGAAGCGTDACPLTA